MNTSKGARAHARGGHPVYVSLKPVCYCLELRPPHSCHVVRKVSLLYREGVSMRSGEGV